MIDKQSQNFVSLLNQFWCIWRNYNATDQQYRSHYRCGFAVDRNVGRVLKAVQLQTVQSSEAFVIQMSGTLLPLSVSKFWRYAAFHRRQLSPLRCDARYIRGGTQNIPDWWRHIYGSCGSAKRQSEKAKRWIPGSNATFAATAWKRAKTLPRTLARTFLAASPWQRPVSHFRSHPAVSGEIQIAVIPHTP
jgi:hypothetical protein